MEFVLNFFDGFTWQTLLGIFFSVLFGLVPGFNLFQKIKVWLKWEGRKAQFLVMGLSMLITALAMLATGALDVSGLQFTFGTFMTLASTLYGASQMAYLKFKDSGADVGFPPVPGEWGEMP